MTIWSDLRLFSRSGGSGNRALLPADREEPENCLTSESSHHIGYRNRIFGFNPRTLLMVGMPNGSSCLLYSFVQTSLYAIDEHFLVINNCSKLISITNF